MRESMYELMNEWINILVNLVEEMKLFIWAFIIAGISFFS